MTFMKKGYTLQDILWMNEDGRLLFAPTRRTRNMTRNIVKNAVEAIELGIPMPPVYVSEQQNGDYLLLESKDVIYSLLQYLENNIGIEIDPSDVNRRMSFYEIDNENPRLTGMIMRTIVPLQIIEYRSPKYMHMMAGKFIEKFGQRPGNIRFARLSIRKSRIELVERIREVLKAESHGLAGRLSEINIFYMLVVWMVYTNKAGVDEFKYTSNEQYLLEHATYEMDNLRDRYINDFIEHTMYVCNKCEEIDYWRAERFTRGGFNENLRQ